MNLKALKQGFIEQIAAMYDVEEATSIFYITLQKISNLNRSQAMFKALEEVKAIELEQFNQVIRDLNSGIPIQHILQEALFYGLSFEVNAHVLIPRVETEELIHWIVEDVNPEKVHAVMDIGTGSGCLAITLKKHFPQARVYAMDISPEALTVAKRNALTHHAEVAFITADILDYQSALKLDLIVSNPPYIKEDERDAMQAIVLDHEPHQALFVSNENPLLFYKAIADFALTNLNDNGYLFFEINEYLGTETVKMLEGKGLKNITLRKDMQGKDRMIRCRK
ncbi:peptide chain release factor N(5)-glutamine methyltransferase [Pedobacter sp.]|uniref:peptide chain release factor N(5)-glutamine methyltransferase n=1 Tax=Pedobacter sp. TaxID=1411316 RepID=UPI003D7F5376